MIDSLVRLLPAAQSAKVESLPERYALFTLHRPANVDDSATLKGILESLLEANRDLAVLFPAHPRTRQRIADFGLSAGQLRVLDPLPYVDFLGLQSRANRGDHRFRRHSGRDDVSWRPLSYGTREHRMTNYGSYGTNVLVGRDPEKLRRELSRVLSGKAKKGTVPPLWDGHAGERIADILSGQPVTGLSGN